MTVAIVVFTHLIGIPSPTQGRVPFWFPFVFSFSLGFTGGLVAPHLYRQARREELALPGQPLASHQGETGNHSMSPA